MDEKCAVGATASLPEVSKEAALSFLKKPALVINRCPDKTIRAFRDLADSDFCSDYGMTLKFLVDSATDKRYEELSSRVTQLEQKKPKKRIKMCDGIEKEV
jgi:hypothetical protein